MSDFTTFVNTELPIRPALLHGNGSPVVSQPPAIRGTLYREQDADPERMWVRYGDGAAEWTSFQLGASPFRVSEGGPYTSIQDAIDDAATTVGSQTCAIVDVMQGVYVEDVTLPKRVILNGQSSRNKGAVSVLHGTLTVQGTVADGTPNLSGLSNMTIWGDADKHAIHCYSPAGEVSNLWCWNSDVLSTAGAGTATTPIIRVEVVSSTAGSAGLALYDCRVFALNIGSGVPAIYLTNNRTGLLSAWVEAHVDTALNQWPHGAGYLLVDCVNGRFSVAGSDSWLVGSVHGDSGSKLEAYGCNLTANYGPVYDCDGEIDLRSPRKIRGTGSYFIAGSATLETDLLITTGTSPVPLDPALTLVKTQPLLCYTAAEATDWLSMQDFTAPAIDELAYRAPRGGAWASVPTTNLFDGRVYFDTTLQKPFFYDTTTTTWYDAAGVAHP